MHQTQHATNRHFTLSLTQHTHPTRTPSNKDTRRAGAEAASVWRQDGRVSEGGEGWVQLRVRGALAPLRFRVRLSHAAPVPAPHDTLHPRPYTLHPRPYTLDPRPYTLDPRPYTLDPRP
eukprot:2161178-Rhodomonas_salina.1